MYTSIDDEAVINEDMWRAWRQKSKLREKKTARKIAATTILVILAAGGTLYLLMVK